MADFEQRADDYGTTILKLIRVTESTGGGVRVFGNILLSEKHYKEGDNEMMIVRIISIVGNSRSSSAVNQSAASDKLSLNKLTATVNHRTNTIDFGPLQGVYLDDSIRGRGIGTFAFNEIIRWLKNNFAEYSINPFEFVTPDGAGEEVKERRNRFLENFGFVVGYTDVTQKSGTMKAKKPALLKEYFNSEKIDELDIEGYVFNLINDKTKLEKDYNELKVEFTARGEEIMKGMPKADLVKYTIIGSVLIVLLMIFLLI